MKANDRMYNLELRPGSVKRSPFASSLLMEITSFYNNLLYDRASRNRSDQEELLLSLINGLRVVLIAEFPRFSFPDVSKFSKC